VSERDVGPTGVTAPRAYLTSLEQIGIKLGLAQIRSLLAALDHPERAYRALTIAGTNGKGSVTAMVERGLRAAGYRTGRYTSPHLVCLEERFAIDGLDVSASQLDAAIEVVQTAAGTLTAPPSFFEATTAVALELFRRARVNVALLEVGLGGRLDATNAVASQASAITAIDFDHQQFLGTTLESIATEKAGVIKSGTCCVLAENPLDVRVVVEKRCQDVGARFVYATDGVQLGVAMHEGRAHVDLVTPRRRYADLILALRGRHQVQNAVTAVRLLEELDTEGLFAVSEAAVRCAVEQVSWPGRLELVSVAGQAVLIDGAHNAAGAAALAAFLRDTYVHSLPVVLGAMRDKDIESIVAPIAAVASRIVCTTAGTARAMPPHELAAVVRTIAPGLGVDTCNTAAAAIETAGRGSELVVVAGSLYLAGQVRALVS